ncbi:N-acetyl sugar amidotransferase [Pedobacter flavus]|uniref:N-acetyl sugar amidotransferase n=1 Tax=Pedobacter flavus TaxID=3113906 RepID=A0ABU7H0A2_9SPHI|nr:N-acetyl sugar amidotransferase [Pedobacter sp. VNH31]MEE1884712.1 N-acetyl sugar amidotransferase [Pedobacter sp. VNH31]
MHNTEYRQCSYCIMDTTDSRIEFDENGECNHCREYKDYEKNYKLKGEAAKKQTDKIVAQMKAAGKGKEYDCIMGISGGVDSSYLAYYATKVLGLRVLLVHVDTGWNSELAVKNIENIVRILNLDLHTLVIDWEEMRDLQRSMFLSSVPNCDIPQDHAFIASLYSEAKKYGLKHILNGGNMSTESILPQSWGYDASDWVHLKDIHNKFGKVKLKQYPHISFFKKSIYYPYILKLKVHRPLEYIEYNKADTKKFLIENLGWKDYGGKHFESKYTQFFQAHYLPTKFGYDKRLAHLSSLIVSGQMTREEALEEMAKPIYDANQLIEDREYFIKKLGFTIDEWNKIMSAPLKTEHDYKNNIFIKNAFMRFLELVLPVISVIKKIKNR